MEIFNNTTKVVKDDLIRTIRTGSRVSVAAATFSIYAFQELKDRLESCETFRFIFTSPTFVAEKTAKERREFYIPRLKREKSLYGTEFEIRLRNELKQKAIAKECSEWIKAKAVFKTNTTYEGMNNFLVVDDNEESYVYSPLNSFTTVDLGSERGNTLTNMVTRLEAPACTEFLQTFDEIWNDKERLKNVTEEVIDMISSVYTPTNYILPSRLFKYLDDMIADGHETRVSENAFNKGTVKHIFFVAETKGTMESLKLKPVEQTKIRCAKKLFNELSTEDVVYHDVDSYQSLLDIMEKL